VQSPGPPSPTLGPNAFPNVAEARPGSPELSVLHRPPAPAADRGAGRCFGRGVSPDRGGPIVPVLRVDPKSPLERPGARPSGSHGSFRFGKRLKDGGRPAHFFSRAVRAALGHLGRLCHQQPPGTRDGTMARGLQSRAPSRSPVVGAKITGSLGVDKPIRFFPGRRALGIAPFRFFRWGAPTRAGRTAGRKPRPTCPGAAGCQRKRRQHPSATSRHDTGGAAAILSHPPHQARRPRTAAQQQNREQRLNLKRTQGGAVPQRLKWSTNLLDAGWGDDSLHGGGTNNISRVDSDGRSYWIDRLF